MGNHFPILEVLEQSWNDSTGTPGHRRRSPQVIIVRGRVGARKVERIETERMDAAWTQREILEKEEWEAQAKTGIEEEIGRELEGVTTWWQAHYEKEKKSCEGEVSQAL